MDQVAPASVDRVEVDRVGVVRVGVVRVPVVRGREASEDRGEGTSACLRSETFSPHSCWINCS